MTALAIVASLLAVVGWVVAARQWVRANAERERRQQAVLDLYLTRTASRSDPWAALRLADAKVRETSLAGGAVDAVSGDGHGLNAAVKRVEELSILVAALTQDRDDRIAALLRALDGTNAVLSAAYARLRAAQDETSEARAERDRLVEAVRALADELCSGRIGPKTCAIELVALLPTTGPSQADAEVSDA